METLAQQFYANSGMELAAVLLGVLYIVLASRENTWCWPPAFISSALFIYIFFQTKLYFDGALNIYYAAMAVYGWHQWKGGRETGTKPIRWWPARAHLATIFSGLALAMGLGYWAFTQTDASFPFLDSFTTVFSLITTWMVTQKIIENWIYWFVIDGVSIYLYIEKELYFTTMLFTLYVIIVIFGFYEWRKHWKNQTSS